MFTKKGLHQYNKTGAYYPITIFPEEEMKKYLQKFEILESKVKEQGLKFHQPHLHFGWVYDIVTDPKILAIVEKILGSNFLVHSSSFFAKNPEEGSFVSWHQDGHYWEQDEPVLTSVWLAFTCSISKNGCLRVIPGTHKIRLPHGTKGKHTNNLLSSGMQVATDFDESLAEDVELKPGQISLHNVNILHGSNANTSSLKRVGLAIRYLPTHIAQKRIHHEVVLAKGEDQYGHYECLDKIPGNDMEENILLMKKKSEIWTARTKKQGLYQ